MTGRGLGAISRELRMNPRLWLRLIRLPCLRFNLGPRGESEVVGHLLMEGPRLCGPWLAETRAVQPPHFRLRTDQAGKNL